ncbi:class F sortase [Nocardioides sp. P86]|uniref:class F sortase n=1 Tax=Nocardioides sp. P86 TaxID=2939569 RepID=UPI00203F2128|nr:class F sortase [Nocardioides sp. P86]MCM3517159.1 class F sortase [Nocardioides sp. P86]
MSSRPVARRAAAVTLLVVAGVAALVAVRAGEGPQAASSPAAAAPSAAADPTAPTAPSGSSAPSSGASTIPVQGATAARPVEVRVPRLGIVSRLDDLAVLADGTLERPPRWQVAGWYAAGPRPGETGPAVIAGHVDSPTGPAVFTGLEALRPGDLVEVLGDDGTTTSFTVDRLATAPKDAFPTRAVYGQTPDAQLRLITCDGAYVADAGGYQDNLIVFATERA